MKIKEIMCREVKSLSPEMSVKEAWELLSQMEISGLPVIDKEGKLLGMFTEKDILKKIFPGYLDKVGRFVYEENPKGIKKKVSEFEKLKVKELMRLEVITVDEDTALCEVARIMLTQKVRRIPVLNKEKKVVGIIARQDVLRGLLGD
ncbi:MAG: HPP family protein, partial [Candidatus Omnitrophota bacterium]